MKKALTIIIPAYNVSNYIDQGMSSLLEDKTIIPFLDIILVNDGSEDDTLEKGKQYEEQYPESVCVIDKKNGGHGSGINAGIRVAKGQYLKVLDGDDWVRTDGLKELVEYINGCKTEPDIIINPFEKVWEDGKREIVSFELVQAKEIVGFKDVVENNYTLPLHSLTIRRQVYFDNNIPQIDEKISYDDMEYILYPIPYIHRIVFLERVIYEYRLGLQGQSMNPEQMKRKLPMHKKVIESLANYYRNNKELFNGDQAKYYMQECIDTIGTNCDIQISTGVAYNEVKEFLKSYNDFPLLSTRKRKMKYLLKYNKAGYVAIKLLKYLGQ